MFVCQRRESHVRTGRELINRQPRASFTNRWNLLLWLICVTWNRRSNLSFVSSRSSAVSRTTISSRRGDRLPNLRPGAAHARQITHPRECDAAVDQRLSRRAKTRRTFRFIDQIDCRRAEDFLSVSRRQEVLERDPTETLTLPRIERYLPETLNELQVEQLIESIDTKHPLGLRDRAMIELLYASGCAFPNWRMRVWKIWMSNERILRVTGKGNKTRLVPVGQKACAAIASYLSTERPKLVKRRTGSEIFLSARGTKLTTARIWQIVKECARRSGSGDEYLSAFAAA